MPVPQAADVLTQEELDRLTALVVAGDERALREELERTDLASRLRNTLAASLGAGLAVALSQGELDGASVQVLKDAELLGSSWGKTRWGRAYNTARLAGLQLKNSRRSIQYQAESARQRPRKKFVIGGAGSSEEYAHKLERAQARGARPSEVEAIVEAEIKRVLERARLLELQRLLYILERYLRTEYDATINHLRIDKMERDGVQYVQIIAQPGYCAICAPFAFQKYPIQMVPSPPYHPNCRCRPRALGPNSPLLPKI